MSFSFGWHPTAAPRGITSAWSGYVEMLAAFRSLRREEIPSHVVRPESFVMELEAAVRRAPRRDIETIGRDVWARRYPHD